MNENSTVFLYPDKTEHLRAFSELEKERAVLSAWVEGLEKEAVERAKASLRGDHLLSHREGCPAARALGAICTINDWLDGLEGSAEEGDFSEVKECVAGIRGELWKLSPWGVRKEGDAE